MVGIVGTVGMVGTVGIAVEYLVANFLTSCVELYVVDSNIRFIDSFNVLFHGSVSDTRGSRFN